MKVLITIDTETHPLRSDWWNEGLSEDLRRDVYAETCEGEFGVRYLARVLREHRLKGVFFTEPLFTEFTEIAPLEEIVREIHASYHEVQAHPHPEWLARAGVAPYCDRGPQCMRCLSPTEQTDVVLRGIARLREAGARDVCAFRAADWSVTRETLRALSQQGIPYDASYNPCRPALPLGDIPELKGRSHPIQCEGVWSLPLAAWCALPAVLRPAEVTPASVAELRDALLSASRAGWPTFVLRTHSFGLLRDRRRRVYDPRPDWEAIEAFEGLCTFLADRREELPTCGFADLDPAMLAAAQAAPPVRLPVHRTVQRFIQQTYRSLTATS